MSLWVLSLLIAAPVELASDGDEKPKIIVLDLVNGTDLEEAQLEALSDAIVSALSGAPVEVLSAADLRKTVAVKATQSALGCHQGDCLLDLAKAWQARYVLTGSLASFKGQMILNLKLIDSDNNNLKVLLRETLEAEPEALTALTRVSAAKVRQALGGPPPSDAEMAVLEAGKIPVVGLTLGALSFVASAGVLWFQLQANEAGDRALGIARDPIAAPYYADQSDTHVASARWFALGSSVTLALATWSWVNGL